MTDLLIQLYFLAGSALIGWCVYDGTRADTSQKSRARNLAAAALLTALYFQSIAVAHAQGVWS